MYQNILLLFKSQYQFERFGWQTHEQVFCQISLGNTSGRVVISLEKKDNVMGNFVNVFKITF